MGEPAVVFDRVWKKFQTGERHDSLRDLIPAAVKAAFRRRTPAELGDREFWALQDVSFAVRRGEALGIIGANGAGKSTTLKLLSRILRPTRGHCRLQGRVGALIEVAAGFHPDLTGRENVFLQGAIMGMSRAEVQRKFDEIVEFSDVARFIDTPVKRYSSGMNARLGFAIAAHLEPDVLLIDEVLSVGDMAFQRRCVERMLQIKQRGVAVVFVSHDLSAVARMCEQSILLEAGQVAAHGATAMVIDRYASAQGRQSEPSTTLDGTSGRILHVTTPPGRDLMTLHPGDRIAVRLAITAPEQRMPGTLVVYVTQGLSTIANTFHAIDTRNLVRSNGEQILDVTLSANLLRGVYTLTFLAYDRDAVTYAAIGAPLTLAVDELTSWAGTAHLAVEVAPAAERSRLVAVRL